MKKLLLFLMLGIFLISLTSAAQSSLGTFKQDSCIDLTQTCTSCTYNNLTSIIYPNGTKYSFSPEQNMTKSDSEYLFQTCDFSSDLGNYKVNGHGDLSGTDTVWNYEYEITKSGQSITEGKTLGGLGIFFGILATSFIFMFIGSKLSQNDKTLPIGFSFSVMSIILVIYSLHLGWVFSVDILQHEIISGGLEVIFLVVLWSSAGIALISIIMMFFAFVKELGKMNKKKKFGQDFNPISDTYE